MRRESFSYANVMSTIAVFVALGGTSYAVARNSVGTPQLKRGAVTSAKVKDGTLQRRDLSSASIAAGPRGPRGVAGPKGEPGANGANATIEAWRPLELGSGWIAHSSPDFPPPGFRSDSRGIVCLRGVVNAPGSDAPISGQVIATLPAGYRPDYRILAVAVTGASGSPTTIGRLDIHTNGQIVWFAGAGTSSDYTSLDDVCFATGA